MKRRIFLYNMILVIIGITITGFFISELTQSLYKGEVEGNLKNTVVLINNEISEKAGKQIDYNVEAKRYSQLLNPNQNSSNIDSTKETNIRITFINFNGKVLGESEANSNKMENHLGRKEIQQAIQGKIGEDIRISKTLNLNFLYIASALKSQGIITRVSVPLILLKRIDEIIWRYTIIGIFVGLLFTALIAFKFSSSLIRPINQLISISKEMLNGNYSKRASATANDELGQLSNTFNEMSTKLEKTVADLVDKNVEFDTIVNSIINGIIAVDRHLQIILMNLKAREMFNIDKDKDALGINIIEIIRNNQVNLNIQKTIAKNISLSDEVNISSPSDKVYRIFTNPIRSNDESFLNSGGIIFIQDVTNIKKLEQIRTDFVSNVTHELKTPLTSIRGFVETLRFGAINDPTVSEKFLEIIDIEAERLYILINDILQLSEIETIKVDTNLAKHDLKFITDEVISILQGVADKKRITLVNETDDNIAILANKDRLKQMLINLIDNGIKYNVENGRVVVKAYKTGGKIVIAVKDTGIGIAKEHLPRVFERFYRVDKGRSRNMGGTGLGLSIVKHIVNLYNGDVKVNSELGLGTEFIIKLPQ
jgi:two-component system, OmpR family, phosphate regulon sensor histidine kinase PhoR